MSAVPNIGAVVARASSIRMMLQGLNVQARTLHDRARHNVPMPRETLESHAGDVEDALMQMGKLLNELNVMADAQPAPAVLPAGQASKFDADVADLPLPADFLIIGPRSDRAPSDPAAREFIADLKSDFKGRAR